MLFVYWTSSDSGRPKLFMVKLDIQKCFDSVKQDKVLEVMQEALKDVMYTRQIVCSRRERTRSIAMSMLMVGNPLV